VDHLAAAGRHRTPCCPQTSHRAAPQPFGPTAPQKLLGCWCRNRGRRSRPWPRCHRP
jgi:hypothetical protein